MDYINPEHRRLRDEPTKPLSPEEAAIAAANYQKWVLDTLNATIAKAFPMGPLSLPNKNTNNNEEDDSSRNSSRFN